MAKRARRLRRWLLLAGAGALAATALLGAWGVLIEPRLVARRRISAEIPNLPPGWAGQDVALLGDLQIGAPLANVDAVRRAIQHVVEARPAAVLLAGDYVYDLAREPTEVVQDVVELLRPLLDAAIPTLGVLGNHDFAMEGTSNPAAQHAYAAAVVGALERAGVRVLRNAAVALDGPDPTQPALYIVGLGEHAVGEDNWRAAFREVPHGAPRIVLAHDPAALKPIPAGWAPLALAGHTHGGQIRLPFAPELAPARWWMPWPEYVDGWVRGFLRPGNRLFVNRGIGFSHAPVRIGAPPELTLVTLRAPRRAGGMPTAGTLLTRTHDSIAQLEE